MNEQLLQMMQTDPAAARRMLEATVAERSASDPMLAMMMKMMSSQRGEESPQEPRRRERVERVRAHVGELRAALSSAHDLLEDIADALGACDACWGSDDRCQGCRGRGAPGWRMPNEQLFTELVEPAVTRRAKGHKTERDTE